VADPKEESFGRLATRAASPQALLDAEEAHGRAKGFAALDSLIGKLTFRALRGETLFSVEGVDEIGVAGRMATLRLGGLSSEERELLEDRFSLENQQARGNWSLPEKIGGGLGRLHFPHHLREHGRFFHESVESDANWPVSTAASPEALLVNSVLEPLFSSLYEPLRLRSGRAFSLNEVDSTEKGRERRLARWREAEAFLSALDLEVEPEFAAIRPGGGWSKLAGLEQRAAKAALADALRREAERLGPSLLGGRYRAHRLLPLLSRYYAKATKDGRVLRRSALTRGLEGTLSGFFGGDWLAFLDYLGEEPHPEEHVATAVPEAKLYLGPSRKVAEGLGAEGISDEQLRLIAASLFGGETSPVEKRLSALRRYWQEFDSLHARQRSGMEPLWGLVEEWGGFSLSDHQEDSPHREGLYRRVLSAELLEEISELWGTVMLRREPGKIVTEPFPHARLAETFGPALRFWHGCALTAWFLCEGPHSRTDMAGLEYYHRRELAELEDLGAPVDRGMFAELVAGERRLEPPEPVYGETRGVEVDSGLVIQTSMSSNSRRAGFESLRDVITKHRGAWAEAHLERYLRSRAEGDVREAALVFYRKSAERNGKPPTPKQFASTAVAPANRWFGGDISLLYRAFGERSPVSPELSRLVPEDVEAFVERVYAALGGVEVEPYSFGLDEKEKEEHHRKSIENSSRSQLANMALDYLRLEEALGRPPALKEIGRSKFEYRAEEAGLGPVVEEAWIRYERLVRKALAGEGPKRQAQRPEKRGTREQPRKPVPEVTREGSKRTEEPSEEGGGKSGTEAPSETYAAPRKPWWRRLVDS
jgi:hypothetical protein